MDNDGDAPRWDCHTCRHDEGCFLDIRRQRQAGLGRQRPFCDGWPINHIIGDPATGVLWAGAGGDWHGAGAWRSEDAGATWQVAKLTKGLIDDWAANDPQLAAMTNWTARPPPFADQFPQIWSLGYAHGTLYAGTKPARLLSSRDRGKNWEEVQGLRDHPSAGSWNPGGAGLVLHTILSDPANANKLWVGISAAGVFATEDGARRRNRTLRPQHDAARLTCFISKIITASGVLPMAAGVGMTSRAVFPQRSAFQSAFIRGSRNCLDRASER